MVSISLAMIIERFRVLSQTCGRDVFLGFFNPRIRDAVLHELCDGMTPDPPVACTGRGWLCQTKVGHA